MLFNKQGVLLYLWMWAFVTGDDYGQHVSSVI